MSLRVMLSTVLMILTMTLSAGADGLQRLYVLDCGRNVGKDQSRWSPGVNEGKPIEFSDNCYLIRHDKGLLLWDTGVPDAVAGMADGMVVANGAITWPATTTCSATGARRSSPRRGTRPVTSPSWCGYPGRERSSCPVTRSTSRTTGRTSGCPR
jgi:hypothetical protein